MNYQYPSQIKFVAICLVFTTCLFTNAVGQVIPPAAVVASPVVEQEIRVGETFVGTVLPVKMATIGSAVPGRVIELLVDEGDLVEDGGAIAQLLTSTIELEREAAIGELELREHELEELRNGTRAEELEQAEARVKTAEARLNYMAKRRDRSNDLYRNGQAASREELDEAVSAADVAIQAVREAHAALRLAQAGPRKEKIAQAEAQVKAQRAVVDRLSDQIAKHTIRARFRGYVTRKHTEVGAWVQSGDPAVDLVALDAVEIEAFVMEKHIPFVAVGSLVRVEVPALGDRLFDGEVVAVVPQADVRARTFPVRVRVTNQITSSGPLIKSGMFARVQLPTGDRKRATLVSKDALVLGGPQPIVFVVPTTKDPSTAAQVVAVPVQMGVSWGDHIQVTGEIKAGQLTVVEGNERLRPSQTVTVTRVVQPELPELATLESTNGPKDGEGSIAQ